MSCFNKLIIYSKFNDIIDELKIINISLPAMGIHGAFIVNK